MCACARPTVMPRWFRRASRTGGEADAERVARMVPAPCIMREPVANPH